MDAHIKKIAPTEEVPFKIIKHKCPPHAVEKDPTKLHMIKKEKAVRVPPLPIESLPIN